MRFSRGVAYLNPQGAGAAPAGQGSAEAGAQEEADLVAQAFSALQARKEGTPTPGPVRQPNRHDPEQQVQVPPICTQLMSFFSFEHICSAA